jgi:succinate dehydrogenase / fumarate reductase iron-sulfur subunit
MEARLRVSRFDPESGDGVRYQPYVLEVPDYATVLDVLLQIRDEVDDSLALRCSCRSAICGSCAMRINRQARLACKTKVKALAADGEEIVVEPMGNMPVVKDLVAEMDSFWQKVRAIEPWLQPEGPPPEREYLVPHEVMRSLADIAACILCGACVSDCTVLETELALDKPSEQTFLGPAALAKGHRFVGDPRDGADADRLLALSRIEGMWDCTRCNVCVEVCPKDVRPMDRIMELRRGAVVSGITRSAGARHSQAFARSVRRLGRLEEVGLVPASVGWFNLGRLAGELPGALRMLRVGKLPWTHATPFHRPIPGIQHVRQIFDKVRREGEGEVSP